MQNEYVEQRFYDREEEQIVKLKWWIGLDEMRVLFLEGGFERKKAGEVV